VSRRLRRRRCSGIFTLPQGNWITHRSTNGKARLFIYSDREVFARLGLLKEEYGNAAR
jgi:gentisate 1,2-dioxygenase